MKYTADKTVILNKISLLLCVSLALTGLSFFSIGLAEITIFHAMVLVHLTYLAVRVLLGKTTPFRVSFSVAFLILYLSFFYVIAAPLAKFTSFVYSVVILIEIAILSNITSKLEIKEIRRVVQLIIFLFFFAIVVEALMIAFYVSDVGFLGAIFKVYNDGRQIRPMGLSSEPSYSAIILVLCLYLLFRTDNFRFNRKRRFWYLLSICSIFLSGSSYGYLLLILLVSFVASKNWKALLKPLIVKNGLYVLIGLCVTLLAITPFLLNLNSRPLARLTNIFDTFQKSGWNIKETIATVFISDSSAGMRVMPTVQLIESYDKTDLFHILFGWGAGQSSVFYSGLYGQLTLLGFIPAYIFNYGILGTSLTLFLLLFSFFPKKKIILTFIFTLVLFNADFNTQLFVFGLFVAMVSRRIEKISSEDDLQHIVALQRN